VSVLQTVILGIIQGLTEFIPVSSSAHLVLIPDVLRWAQPTVFLDVMLHVGTLVAATVYFWKDIIEIITKKRKMIWLLAIGTVPAVLLGLAFKHQLESFFQKPVYSAYFLIVTGLFLAAADYLAKKSKETKDITPLNALWIGAAQAIAILPGISRSGATITAGMFAGLGRKEATRFAFLLSIPIIAGTALLKAKDALAASGGMSAITGAIPGAIAAAIVGYLAIHFLLKYLTNHKLIVFSVYCWLVAGLYLLTR
jgi:undecaprenyl-diphosphatase